MSDISLSKNAEKIVGGGSMAWLYYKEKMKADFYNFVLRHGGRLQTSMIQLKNTLKMRGFWKGSMDCLEMFGMFGLWNTIYYIEDVRHVDFFELDSEIIKYARKNLSKYNVDFFNEDSIAYIKETSKTYDFIYADVPFGLEIFDNITCLPDYTKDALEHLNKGGIFVSNMREEGSRHIEEIKRRIENFCSNDTDVFFVSRRGMGETEYTSCYVCIVLAG